MLLTDGPSLAWLNIDLPMNSIPMLTPSRTLVAALIASVLTLPCAAAAIDPAKLPPAAKTPGVTFAKDIKPLFEKSCFKCHGAEKQKGKLRLDTLEAALKGGENAPNLIPGDSAKSALVASIARVGDEDDFMPPKDKGEPFTKEQVGLVRAWIDQGAK